MKSFLNKLDRFEQRHAVWLQPLYLALFSIIMLVVVIFKSPAALEVFNDLIDLSMLTDEQNLGASIYLSVVSGMLMCSIVGAVFKLCDWLDSKIFKRKKST